jgi:hypothetical protein
MATKKLLDVPRYVVDLQEPADGSRWDSLLTDRWAVRAASKLCNEAESQLAERVPAPIKAILKFLVNSTHAMYGNYRDDISAWSDWAIGDTSSVAVSNLMYEIISVSRRAGRLVGYSGLCTSVAFQKPRWGMLHARNLDWPLEGIRKSSILIDFVGAPAGPYTAVSVPGCVGVVSGCAKGRFSLSLNQAPATQGPSRFGTSATFLLREIFESCHTYEEALHVLEHSRTIFPCFVQIVGAKRGEAAVVELMPSSTNGSYEFEGEPLGLTNHFLDDEDFEDDEWEEDGEDYITDSLPRLNSVENAAERCKPKSLVAALAPVSRSPVMNENTVQSMIMHPKSGTILLQKTRGG